MALATLERASIPGMSYFGVTHQEVKEMSPIKTHYLGELAIDGLTGESWRTFCGPDGTAKGGERIMYYPTNKDAVANSIELSTEMWYKILAGCYDEFRGGKGVTNFPVHLLNASQKIELRGQITALQIKAGIACARYNSGAGDINTNGLSDVAALVYQNLVPDDPYWQATVTGKTPDLGGLGFRTKATGYGGFIAQQTLLGEVIERPDERYPTAIQGFGNVGGWYAHFASTETTNTPVRAISDMGGVLICEDPRGMVITEAMVRDIADNPRFEGNKILALQKALEADGQQTTYRQNSNDLFDAPVSHLVLAAGGNVITKDNMSQLGILKHPDINSTAIIELANGPLTADAHEFLTNMGVTIVPDFIANSGGVNCSITEYRANIAMVDETINHPPSDEDVRKGLTTSMSGLVVGTVEMAKLLGTTDLRPGGAGLAIGRMIMRSGGTISPDVRGLMVAA